MRVLTIVIRHNGKAWVARGENCYGTGTTVDKALKKAKDDFLYNLKGNRDWEGRLNKARRLLAAEPLSTRAEWNRVEVAYSLEGDEHDAHA